MVIVGGGFAGLKAAKGLANTNDIDVTLLDGRNHPLFQPLLYQVATAGLSPAEIAAPIRGILSNARNFRVVQEQVGDVDLSRRVVISDSSEHPYDYLLLACGSRHAYFGHDEWEVHAPGLKTLEQATEIRRRVLTAFEEAEKETAPERKRALLTFVIVGGGPTGVELAGAIGEMSRFTLAKDFRHIDRTLARVILVEAGPRILPTFDETLSGRAARDLEKLGVQIWSRSMVTHIDADLDRQGRVIAGPDLSLPGHPEVFVAGDQAHVSGPDGTPLPGMAPAALQRGQYVAQRIRAGCVAARTRTSVSATRGRWRPSVDVEPSCNWIDSGSADSRRGCPGWSSMSTISLDSRTVSSWCSSGPGRISATIVARASSSESAGASTMTEVTMNRWWE
jgi:NADH dehydrogenase